ncbi:MAG: aminotransferase class I/II-fold pyridoxal phosphate-dependent enzyme, partial [Acidobacteriota bacterium]
MHIPRFAMERMQSTYENLVDYNLSESGVHPMRLEELVLSADDRAALLAQELLYTQSNGTVELRERIAALYPGSTVDHIEVTNGGSEANFVTMWHLIEPGDEVVMMVPNYGQTLGLVEGFGGLLRPWPLHLSADGRRWTVDLDDLRTLVTARTRAIVICNPN